MEIRRRRSRNRSKVDTDVQTSPCRLQNWADRQRIHLQITLCKVPGSYIHPLAHSTKSFNNNLSTFLIDDLMFSKGDIRRALQVEETKDYNSPQLMYCPIQPCLHFGSLESCKCCI